ncbi:hypothetical protein IC617_07530 [Neiella sp. HB171785]|uniref:Uncharacterized protein n=1 Tax=Neiella litorisoli TaxID=2771431 RepID=A0A8J6QQC4_9GAMM|nr:hypothetical protein [Neiella litorisoli]MBD1389271.1 hypothetical protein [Neiella litorisoli]
MDDFINLSEQFGGPDNLNDRLRPQIFVIDNSRYGPKLFLERGLGNRTPVDIDMSKIDASTQALLWSQGVRLDEHHRAMLEHCQLELGLSAECAIGMTAWLVLIEPVHMRLNPDRQTNKRAKVGDLARLVHEPYRVFLVASLADGNLVTAIELSPDRSNVLGVYKAAKHYFEAIGDSDVG